MMLPAFSEDLYNGRAFVLLYENDAQIFHGVVVAPDGMGSGQAHVTVNETFALIKENNDDWSFTDIITLLRENGWDIFTPTVWSNSNKTIKCPTDYPIRDLMRWAMELDSDGTDEEKPLVKLIQWAIKKIKVKSIKEPTDYPMRDLKHWATEMKAEGTEDEQHLVELLFWVIQRIERMK
ncbi:TPA: hypothetical protein HA278_04320 [Candidatus Woesearchaeota archaeon]|jgi:hypothetical protein|nr:hypothetical protein [Candidatus Woesearchaeota archaeon]